MALLVQVSNGNLSTMTWYKGDEIEYDANYLWPFNQEGSHKGYEEIRTSSNPLYIQFSSSNAVNLQGVILSIYSGSSGTDYDRDITVELEESTDGGSTWTSVRTKTIHFPDDINAGPEKQYGKYMIDFRFDSSYTVSTSNDYRFKIYRSSSGFGSLYLQLSKDASRSSWTADVSDYAFRIIYSDTTGTPTSSDVFVITDELTIDQDWTVGYITIPTSPSKDRLDSYNNKGSFWITAKGRLYVPSSITSNITVEVKGRMYIGSGDRVAWQIGDSETNPIPSSRTVNWYFNCDGTTRRAGIYTYRSSWMKIEHYGSEITNWYAVLKEDASSGSNQIIVEGDVTGEWQVGDELSIGGTKYSSTRHYNDYQRDHHYYEISALSYDSGNDETTITLTSTLSRMKEAGGRVLLIRRNVNIYGDNISSTNNRADTYIYYMRWWRAYWIRYHHMRYPAYFETYNSKISISDYPHTDIFKGVLVDNCKYFYIRSRKGGQMEKIAICDNKLSGWSWGDGAYILYKCSNFTVSEVIGITSYFPLQFSQASNNTLSNFWIHSQYGIYIYLSSNNEVYNGTVFNSRYGVYFAGSNNNELYDIDFKNIYYDSDDLPTETSSQGCFYYGSDMISQNNYIHDVTVENAFSLFSIDIDDGCTDWYHNITYSGITTEIWDIYREDWLDATKIRFTKKNGVENNDWIIYKYGMVHRTGNYTSADDTTYRSAGGYDYALRLEPQVEGEDFDGYKITLTGCKTNKPVSYLGYIYVSSEYFSGTDVENPEIYLTGLGIDYTSEPTAKWTHPGSSFADQWVSFVVIGTPTSDGNATITIKTHSDGTNPYVYIDDDSYSWAESVDYRSHEVWINGQPANPPAVFPVITSLEIWNQVIKSLSETSTIGRLLTEHTGIITPRYKQIKVNTTERIIYSMEAENSHTIKINIYKQDGTKVVDDVDMTKIGSTRYYYYDWTPTDSSLYIVECFVEDYTIKDSTIINVLSEDEWFSTHSEIQNLPSQIDTQLGSSHGTGSWEGTSPANVWSYTNRTLTQGTKDDEIDAIKAKTDKLQFNVDNDIKATLDGEKVTLTDTTESQIDNIESNVTNYDQYKADTSTLAKESTLQAHRDAVESNIDDKISNIPANVDAQLSSSHGSNSWEGTSPSNVWSYPSRTLTSLSGQPAQDIDSQLSSTHGSDSWEGASPSDIWSYTNRTITDLEDSALDSINDKLSSAHGNSSWEGGGGGVYVTPTSSKGPWTYHLRDKIIKLAEDIKSISLDIQKNTTENFQINEQLIKNNYKLIKEIYNNLVSIIAELEGVSKKSKEDIIKYIKSLDGKFQSIKKQIDSINLKDDIESINEELNDIVKLICKDMSDEAIEELMNELATDTSKRTKGEKR